MSLDTWMLSVTTLGSPEAVTFLCIILAIFLLVHKKPHHFLQFTIFMSLGALSVWFMKHWFEFPRPLGGMINASGYGFPSGHSAMAALFFSLLVYAYLPHLKSKFDKISLIICGFLIAASIAYSRIYLGVHSIVDVIGGISLGLFWFLLSVIFYTHLEQKDKNKHRSRS